jgi:hypothetical protein
MPNTSSTGRLLQIVSRMKRLVPIILVFMSSAVFAAEQVREFKPRGWVFDIPRFLAQKVQDGPDFTVTYFSCAERRMWLGIYEGTAPQEFAKGKAGVRVEKDQIGGQKVTWALWEEGKPEARTFHAELFLLIKSAPSETDGFHIFANAASVDDLDFLRRSVRTGQQKVAANHTMQRMGASRSGQWQFLYRWRLAPTADGGLDVG